MLKKWLTWNKSSKGILLLSSFLCSSLHLGQFNKVHMPDGFDLRIGSFEGLGRGIW